MTKFRNRIQKRFFADPTPVKKKPSCGEDLWDFAVDPDCEEEQSVLENQRGVEKRENMKRDKRREKFHHIERGQMSESYGDAYSGQMLIGYSQAEDEYDRILARMAIQVRVCS